MDSWLEHIPSIFKGYEARNIWNCDKTGCYWKALPDKGLAEKKKECKGGKKNRNYWLQFLFLLMPSVNQSVLLL